MAGTAFSADISASGQRLRLVATETGYGAAANIYTLTPYRNEVDRPSALLCVAGSGARWAEWELREYLRTIVGKAPAVRIKWTCSKPRTTSR